uniref:N-acetyltransferase domain-containing protein n=1 Tax=Panagrolaimus sp. JU765 TaxID=591449 RepID=A0AC34QQC2_9BILA
MPDHVQKSLYVDACIIDPKLHRNGLLDFLVKTIIERGIEQGAQHSFGFAVATGSQKLFLRDYTYEKILILPYNKFVENGKPVFTNCYDGADSCVLIY